MKRKIAKAFAILVFVGFLISFFSIVGKLFYYFKTDIKQSSILNSFEVNSSLNHYPKVTYKDSVNYGRPVDNFKQQEIELHVLNMWKSSNYSFFYNKPLFIDSWFGEQLYVQIDSILSNNDSLGIINEKVDLEHNLDIQFYSYDGYFAYIRDSVLVYNKFLYKQDTTKNVSFNNYLTYESFLEYKDEKWHMLTLEVDTLVDFYPINNRSDSAVSAKIEVLNNKRLRGINYYPENTPWLEFWNNFNQLEVAHDLQIIESLGYNSVRIFLPYSEFFSSGSCNSTNLDNFKWFLEMASNHNVSVVPTLFDFYYEFNTIHYANADRYLECVLSQGDFSNVLFWDIKNEPDLDFEVHGKNVILSFLDFALNRAKMYQPNQLYSIGYSHPRFISLFQDKLDVLSYHYYEKYTQFYDLHDVYCTNINKPIYITEYGVSDANYLWFPFSTTRDEALFQNSQLESIFNKENYNGSFRWTLYDFKHIPDNVVGSLPWRKIPQMHYGVVQPLDKFGVKVKTKTEESNKFKWFFSILTLLVLIAFVLLIKYFKLHEKIKVSHFNYSSSRKGNPK